MRPAANWVMWADPAVIARGVYADERNLCTMPRSVVEADGGMQEGCRRTMRDTLTVVQKRRRALLQDGSALWGRFDDDSEMPLRSLATSSLLEWPRQPPPRLESDESPRCLLADCNVRMFAASWRKLPNDAGTRPWVGASVRRPCPQPRGTRRGFGPGIAHLRRGSGPRRRSRYGSDPQRDRRPWVQLWMYDRHVVMSMAPNSGRRIAGGFTSC